MLDQGGYINYVTLVTVILCWEVLKAACKLWARLIVKACVRTTIPSSTIGASSSKQEVREAVLASRPSVRDDGVQSPCTYKWKHQHPRFQVLPESSSGTFL